MLIRTQNKRNLVDMAGLITVNQYRKLVSQIEHEDTPQEIYNYHIEYSQGELQVTLGTYSTEEKALKVLDMIQKTYESTTSQLSINGFLITQCNKVFEMPADEDVEM